MKGFEAYVNALSIGGLTSIIGRWEGSRLGSAAIIIFVVAMIWTGTWGQFCTIQGGGWALISKGAIHPTGSVMANIGKNMQSTLDESTHHRINFRCKSMRLKLALDSIFYFFICSTLWKFCEKVRSGWINFGFPFHSILHAQSII